MAGEPPPAEATPRPTPRPMLRAHGGPVGDELARLGIAAGDVLDFSVNLNPYGPAPAMLDAIREARLEVYPDATAFAARSALAAMGGVTADRIVLGDGGAGLLWALARLLVGPGQSVLMVEPTFSEFRAAAAAAGARILEWRAGPDFAHDVAHDVAQDVAHDFAHDFAVDLDAIAARARVAEATALYLCAPNNPTGTAVRAAALIALAEALPAVTLIIDQAFLSLSDHHADASIDLPPNAIRVRSLTKEHAIPGVRVGYLIATANLAARVEVARPAWSTSAAAQAAALASGGLAPFVADSRDRLLADRRALVAALRALDLSPRLTSTTFCVAAVGDAARLRQALLSRHRILIRDCASFGLPAYIRLAARPAADRERLIAALRQELGRC